MVHYANLKFIAIHYTPFSTSLACYAGVQVGTTRIIYAEGKKGGERIPLITWTVLLI